MDLTFEQVQQLSVAQHPVWPEHMVQKYVKPEEGPEDAVDEDWNEKPSKGPKAKKPDYVTQSYHQPLALHRKQYETSNLSREGHRSISLREIFTNLFDQATDSNGMPGPPSLANLWFVEGLRDDAHVICLHNGKVRLAEIIHYPQPKPEEKVVFSSKQALSGKQCPSYGILRFVNYGAIVESQSQVLAIGNSGKQGKTNQVGMYGEGLKTAILRLLHCGIGVEIQCCVLGLSAAPVTQRWQFYISERLKDAGILAVATYNFVMQELVPNANDRVRFDLKLTYNHTSYRSSLDREPVPAQPKALGFSMNHYLIDRAYLRDRRDNKDWGSLVPLKPGSLWVWNIFITNDAEHIRFAYNLFVSIGRDRDSVKNDSIMEALTHIWSAILRNPDAGEQHKKLFDLLYPEPQSKWFEYQIVPKLDTYAAAALRGIFTKLYPPETHVFVLKDEENRAKFNLRKTICFITEELRNCLNFPTLNLLIHENITALMAAPLADQTTDGMPYSVANMFRDYIYWRKPAPDVDILYCCFRSNEEKKLCINWPRFLEDFPTEEKMLHQLVVRLLPHEFPDTWNIMPFLNRPLPPVVNDVVNDQNDDVAAGVTKTGRISAFKPLEEVPRKRFRPVAAMAPASSLTDDQLIRKALNTFLPRRFKVRKSVFALIAADEDEDDDDDDDDDDDNEYIE